MKKALPKHMATVRPLIHSLYEAPMTGEAIEALSFQIIEREAPPHRFSSEEWEVVKRMVHAAAEFAIMGEIRFSPDATRCAVEALRCGRPIFVDSCMIRSGISIKRLREACPLYGPQDLICHVADEEVARQAALEGLPRSLFAVRKAADLLHGGIAVFGNAPVALMELVRLILEEGLRPAIVIAMPVGFVHVVESKEELMKLDVPQVVLAGRRGGSPLAVSALHALCTLAARGR